MKSLSRNVFVNTACIMASRVFGLARDIVLGWYWGSTEAAQAAFNVAFAIPNMLRALFAEGAFNAAFVPMVASKLKEGNHKEAEDLASKTITLQCIILAAVVAVGIIASCIVAAYLPSTTEKHVTLIFKILPILLPYAIFICMAGAFASILTCLERFAAPSLNPVIFNIIQIGAVAILWAVGSTRHEFKSLLIFCGSVFFAGVVQMTFLFWMCRRNGFNVRFVSFWKKENALIWRDSEVRTLVTRIVPGLIGSGVFQLNALLDKALAVYLGSAAVGSLGYSQHLVYLPIGIFGVAMSMVCLPQMAKATQDEMSDCLDYALRQVLFMTLPCATLLAVLAEPVIVMLFQRGAFNAEAVRETVWALWFLVPGLPAFCCAKVAVTTHHGRKDTKTPVKISMYCIALNLVLNLTLMQFLRQGGLALATAICSWVNVITLLTIDTKKLPHWNWKSTLKAVVKLTVAAIIAALIAVALDRAFLPASQNLGRFFGAFARVAIGGFPGLATYLVIAKLLKCNELNELLDGIRRRKMKKA